MREIKRVEALKGAVRAAMLAVHGVTGRTDQSAHDVCRLYPDHPAVLAYQEALRALPEGYHTPAQRHYLRSVS